MTDSPGRPLELPEVIVCPACHGALARPEGASLPCTACGRVYPIVDGIPILLLERASPGSVGQA